MPTNPLRALADAARFASRPQRPTQAGGLPAPRAHGAGEIALKARHPHPRVPSLGVLLSRHPAVCLGVIIAASAAFRFLIALGIRNPWILPDEFIYSELAKGIAHHGEWTIRAVPAHRYAPIYPLLISPAYLAKNPELSYPLIKGINAVLMSLAAIPSYFLARRILTRGFALITALLAVVVPSMGYVGEVMTENAFYPIFLTALLLVVSALERPTVPTQCFALGAIGVAFLTRPQAVALVPAYLTAAGLAALARRDVRGTFAAFRVTVGLLAAIVGVVFAFKSIQGKSPTEILGIYSNAVHYYPLSSIPKWIAYHLADLELYLGVLPFVAAVACLPSVFNRRTANPGNVALTSVALAATAWSTLLVATVSSDSKARAPGYPPLPPRVHERYLFYVAPFFFIAFLAWLQSPEQRARWRLTFAAGGIAIALPLLLPYSKLLTNVGSESLALIPWRRVPNTPVVMALVAGALTTVLLVRRRSFIRIQVGLVLLAMWFTGQLAANEMRLASHAVPMGFANTPRWVDRLVHGARVAIVWQDSPSWSASTLRYRQQAIWNYEFFNKSLGEVYYLGRPMQFDLPQTPLRRVGRQLGPADDERPSLAGYRYALTTSTLALSGRIVARDLKAGLVLYELALPLSGDAPRQRR